ncbi:DUF3472 domain-containing protein [Chitinophagaceae bacterium LB-8]|uniref:DUF3472 domain-containing protein n=1 Tax=Paraflavisolibacter caeni TaxID=2982496 RepID=A0A9X3BKA7_9BACT|nr:DUF3472 domain-containing protein [Paraflavisolibacter caeni]MCU7552578.1 DUF3472 domain-containing protein [Paraflavisolibacter caeni]
MKLKNDARQMIVKSLLSLLFFFWLHTIGAQNSSLIKEQSIGCIPVENSIIVPFGGNTWCSSSGKAGGSISNDGIINWTNAAVEFNTYVRVTQRGKVKLWLNGNVPDGKSEISVMALGQTKNVQLQGSEPKDFYVGEWTINDTGYVVFTLKGNTRTGDRFADLFSLKLSGTSINEQTGFVKNNEGNFYYWGRRGPSVHLSYTVPENADVEWFYNEVTVPKDNDVIGSYYMANGFGEGYFGIQVNSLSERRILFSVWSPYSTNDPKQIPEDQRIQLLKKGEGVHAGEFGNEGSGGQSYLRFNWKAGVTYGFLLHGVPDGSDHTIYTAYFFDPEKAGWMLIASFRRPKAATYLKRLHSFLENFIPEQGNINRKVLFANQWVRDAKGNWFELTKARFTGDNTARIGYRKDYAGGLEGDTFYLRNCGFFNTNTPLDTRFERPHSGKQPVITFEKLP